MAHRIPHHQRLFSKNQELHISLTACTHIRMYGLRKENPSGFILQEYSMAKFRVIDGMKRSGHSMDLIQNLLIRLHARQFLQFTKVIWMLSGHQCI